MKRFFALAILLAFLVIPCLSHAEGSGFYAAPKFLMSIQDTGSISRSSVFAGSGIDDYSQFTLGGALALGIDLWPQQMIPLRMEVELALRGNSEKSWSDRGYFLNEVKGVWNNTTLFANLFWDFHNDSDFTPYVGAGLGLAFNYTGYDLKLNSGDKISIDDRQTNFAWNAGAGVAYAFNEVLTLDASYRFVGLGYNEVEGRYLGQKYKVENEPYNNEFMIGLRFNF